MKLIIRACETGHVYAFLNGKSISVQRAFELVTKLKLVRTETTFYEVNNYYE